MKFRRRASPLLLLLLPSLASALSAAARENTQSTLTKDTTPRDVKADPAPSAVIDLNSKSKYEIGTKDAPVDGKDGKPHAGPFVGTEKDPKKESKKAKPAENAELVTPKAKDDHVAMVAADGTPIPEVNDGVMNDPSRQLPKHGTTGTTGGVSEKDKARKAKEGQTGERLEKTPDSPKEAPPLPHGEQAALKPAKEKDVTEKDAPQAETLAGLEV